MPEKHYLNAEDFDAGLKALDQEMNNHEFLVAFAPITIVTAGGFLAISYLKCRKATEDIDYILDPQWAKDEDITVPLQRAMFKVASDLRYHDKWINADLRIFATEPAKEQLFRKAIEQNIVLWNGENIRVLAAPIEWALERKLRRIHNNDKDRDISLDMTDALAILKYLKEMSNGLLNRRAIQTMDINGFDVLPSDQTMDFVASEYRKKYSEEVFETVAEGKG